MDSTVSDEFFEGRARTQGHCARPSSHEVAGQQSAYMVGLGSAGEIGGQNEPNRTKKAAVKICIKCSLLWLFKR